MKKPKLLLGHKELASKGLEDPDEFTQKLAKNKLAKMQ